MIIQFFPPNLPGVLCIFLQCDMYLSYLILRWFLSSIMWILLSFSYICLEYLLTHLFYIFPSFFIWAVFLTNNTKSNFDLRQIWQSVCLKGNFTIFTLCVVFDIFGLNTTILFHIFSLITLSLYLLLIWLVIFSYFCFSLFSYTFLFYYF